MPAPSIELREITQDKFEVFVNGLAGLAISEDAGQTWILSPNIRKYSKSVTKKIESQVQITNAD